MTDLPPPTYSQQDPSDSAHPSHDFASDPQILIIPTIDAVNFQKGFLGVDGERSAIEGELQIKGVDIAKWERV